MNDIASTKGTDEKFCSECGSVIKMKAEICPKCGVRQMGTAHTPGYAPTTPARRDKTTAAILAFFLGGIGAHKFYLGESNIGIFYLIFFWTFIPAIIAIIDFIVLLGMNHDEFNRKYNNT